MPPPPLRVTVVHSAELAPTDPRLARLTDEPGRLQPRIVRVAQGARPWRTALRDTDVVLWADTRARSAVRLPAWYLGTPCLALDDLPDAGAAGGLAESARRPGAGVVSDRPVSVVVPVLDEIRVIDRVLQPLLAQLRADDEVVVVDSGSTDGTRERLAELAAGDPRIQVLEVARCTIAGSRNHGVRTARHDLVACTDAGCEVDPGWLEAFRSAAADCPAPPLLVGVFRAHVGDRLFEAAFAAVAWPDPLELRRASLPWRLWLRTIGPQFSASRVDGRSVAFTRETFERAGGFREDLYTAEDEAFGRDAIDGGAHPVLVPEAAVTWFQRSSARLAFRQFRGYGRGAAAGGSSQQRRVDTIRMGGYLGLAGLSVVGRRRGRVAAGAALAGMLTFPALRVVRRRDPLASLLLLLPAQLVKDTGKMTGTVEALVLGRTGPLRRPE